MLQHLLLGLGTVLIAEISLLILRRQFQSWRDMSWKVTLLFHLCALTLGIWAGFEGSPWVADDPLLWKIFCTTALVLLTLGTFSLVEHLILHRPWHADRKPMVPALVRDVIRLLLVLVVGLFAATQIHRMPLPAVLASSTLVSAMLALAFQDVLRNVFAGMAMQIEGWIKVGDWMMIDDQPAAVVEMSWRSVKLRTNLGVDILEPNTRMIDRQLNNYGSGNRPVAFSFLVGLPYEAPPAEVKEVLLSAARGSADVVPFPEPAALLRAFGDSAIEYDLRVWTRQVQRISAFRDQINSRIWYEVQRAGLYIPFPIRTVHLRDLDRTEEREHQQKIERARELLLRVGLFHTLDSEMLDALASSARKVYYGHGERLVTEGEPGDSLYLIDHGRVLVSKSGDVLGTGTIRLATLESGSFFGERSLLTGEPRTATVTADGGCEVLVLGKKALAPLLEMDPTLADRLCRALAERDEATSTTLEARREKRTRAIGEVVENHASILKRVRDFFRLPQ